MYEFRAENKTGKEIVLFDITRPYRPECKRPPYSMTLTIESVNIPNLKVVGLDVLTYLRTHRRDNELYAVTTDILRLGGTTDIPDGIYEFTLIVNHTLTYKESFASYYFINKHLKELINTNEFDISINQEGYKFKTGTDVRNCELMAVAFAIYYKMLANVALGKKPEANDNLDKLQRLLKIIKPVNRENVNLWI